MSKAKRGTRKGKRGYWHKGKFFTIRQWKAKWANMREAINGRQ